MNPPPQESRTLPVRLTIAIQALITVGFVMFLLRGDWENSFLAGLVILLTLVPAFVWKRYRIAIPPEFQLIAVLFVYLSLYLGSARDFYYRNRGSNKAREPCFRRFSPASRRISTSSRNAVQWLSP